MGTWRCPHCRTVQMESPRCFLCNRSATSCGTCVNFRRAVVSTVGYCALDRQREPLTGEERRPCWSSAGPEAVEGLFSSAGPPPTVAGRRARLVELTPATRNQRGTVSGR